MSWTNQNALKRVFNVFKRFKEQKGKLWDNDIESLQTVSEALENASKKQSIDNVLFLKLVCVNLKERSEHYGDVKMAIRTLADDLKTPIQDNIEKLRISLNHTDKINYLKSIGIDLESYKNQNDILKINENEFIEKLKTNWTFENVEKSAYNTTNDFIKDLDNYK
jgi:hypothetical protein